MLAQHDFDSLAPAMTALNKEGFKESFFAKGDYIETTTSDKQYQPEELMIVRSFRFDGMTNPADEADLYAIEANDGTKGTLVMTYSADQNQNVELIKKIPAASE